MFSIGLSGGIGSGKSTAADLFAALGVSVIDADRIARELVAPGKPALQQITAHFSDSILLADGNLDRARLRRQIFADPEQRIALEAILHPLIHQEMAQRRSELPPDAPYCILCIPLLIEQGGNDLVDRILVVDATRDQQITRASRRDGISREEIEAIIDSQADRVSRLAAADDVISNEADPASLHSQVEQLDRYYRQLASGALCPVA